MCEFRSNSELWLLIKFCPVLQNCASTPPPIGAGQLLAYSLASNDTWSKLVTA